MPTESTNPRSVIRDAVLDERTLTFVESVSQGLPPSAAARAAGYPDYGKQSKRLMANKAVQRLLAFAAKNQTRKKAISREKVHEMVMEAFDIAKMGTDASSMVRAAAELNKMNGFYEPERKVLDLNVNYQQQQAALANMSDDELLELAEGDLIEGECVPVEEPSPQV